MNDILAIKDYKSMMILQVKHMSIKMFKVQHKSLISHIRSQGLLFLVFLFLSCFCYFLHGLDNKKCNNKVEEKQYDIGKMYEVTDNDDG